MKKTALTLKNRLPLLVLPPMDSRDGISTHCPHVLEGWSCDLQSRQSSIRKGRCLSWTMTEVSPCDFLCFYSCWGTILVAAFMGHHFFLPLCVGEKNRIDFFYLFPIIIFLFCIVYLNAFYEQFFYPWAFFSLVARFFSSPWPFWHVFYNVSSNFCVLGIVQYLNFLHIFNNKQYYNINNYK